jgi:ubiquinol-cytochrome c reductase cytochrome c1 subunit
MSKRVLFRSAGTLVLATVLLAGPVAALAAGGGGPAGEPARVDVGNMASLQRGARNFMNYCSGCHSAKYVRYNQLARDLGLTDQQLIDNLMFTATKPTETIDIAMRPADAQRWFGQPPPDLSLITRARGADYVFNFLRSFYVDPARPLGVNNLWLPNASMPHVLWSLQGLQRAVYEEHEHDGQTEKRFVRFELEQPGTLTPAEYDEFVRDIVNFLAYIGEPVKLQRESLGVLVIAFLLVFGVFAYLLKQEIWKDVR